MIPSPSKILCTKFNSRIEPFSRMTRASLDINKEDTN